MRSSARTGAIASDGPTGFVKAEDMRKAETGSKRLGLAPSLGGHAWLRDGVTAEANAKTWKERRACAAGQEG